MQRRFTFAGKERHLHIMRKFAFLLVILLSLLTACSPAGVAEVVTEDMSWTQLLEYKMSMLETQEADESTPVTCRTWYQVFVYSFYDSDGDGIGDINGVTERLDYIESMGFNGIWLSPIHPSSTYHKYNVRDYYDIDPEYGTLDDFDALIEACHARGIHVILDMVVNHSDLNHPWFTEHPEYYMIADEPVSGGWSRLPDGRYYECRFWDQMPDFNLENADLRSAFDKVFEFWLGRGADGFRLDAVGEYVTGNISKNIEILAWINNSVKAIKPDAYLVGEYWDTTDTVYKYYDSGIDSLFSFPFAGPSGYLSSLLLKDDFTMDEFLQRTVNACEAIASANPGATDAPFLTNHDMARASGFLRRDINIIKTAWGVMLTQPGNAFVYYGEELGMSGSGRDENKRAPMFWTAEEDAPGMAFGPPGMEEVTHGFLPAVEQVGNPKSIYTYVREAVLLRERYPHISSGSFEVIHVDAGDKAGAVLRTWQGSSITIVYNVSSEETRFALRGTISGVLSAKGEQPRQEGDTLILPGYCIVVLS